ncbi:uncharacterized protein LOC101788766 isoform X1 [Cavia porcellus]|uniref:uncharacterized protein LOC101788766 isoform X1 n=1 Tax=Cavia porcellus TaxID=10141 RepID=UPI002FE115CA
MEEDTFKNIILQHGLHPLSDYHFRMIKSLLAEDLNLKGSKYEECDKIKFADLMAENFKQDEILEKLIALFEMIPPLENTAKLLRKEKPKGVTVFPKRENTCKEIVLLHGLHSLSNYHFQMIKSLMAQHLYLKGSEYEECDKIKFADLMAEKFEKDAGLGTLIALFKMIPPLENTAKFLRKKMPKDLTVFPWSENTCKEIVFLHGLYPLSDYHFRMIKSLLAEELKLKQSEYEECDKIKFADLMAENFKMDAGLGTLIALFEMIPTLENTADLLRKETPKDLTVFSLKENTCKEIVFLHGLYPLSDYHFRMIKSLLAEELILQRSEYEECDKIKFADLMAEKFKMDAGLGTLIAIFELIPPLQNTAELLRKEKPKDLIFFPRKKKTCKEIVFLHGLYPLSDYHFRMIKSLLAEELKLKQKEYKECDKIKLADLMSEKFIMDAGLGTLVALFEMLPPLQNTAELLRKENPKGLNAFRWWETTCKEIVFLHGLYPLSDYHFRMIKFLLAEELKLKRCEYEECDKIKFADLMAENFIMDAGLGKLIALFEMLPPLQNTAELLRKEKPKDLNLSVWKENTCKEIVFLHGLYPLSDYHFRMIKSLLAEELKLKRRQYKECDKIKLADLMAEKFIMDAGLGKLIALFEMLPPLQNSAELLREEKPKDLNLSVWKENTCKEIVFLHGLYPLSDYHFRMIKSLLAEELKLKRRQYKECDKIKLADLMAEKFKIDAGLGTLVALFEMLPPLQNTAELLRKENPKGSTAFPWRKYTCKEIVFLHGLYPLSDYHFRMIKCLLAEELKLKRGEYEECDKIKFADLMADNFIVDAGLGKLITLFQMLPPLQNTARLLRKENPKDLTLFTWKENTCKEIVFLHGLYPLSDYHFRMIKSLLAEELKLKPREYKECDRIKFADLMAEKFIMDAGLGKLIALFEMLPPLQNTAEHLRKQKPKGLTAFPLKKNTCKEIVFLHGLYPLSDDDFRMIKFLLAKELKLERCEYEECDKIKFADLMAENFIMDAGLGNLIALFEMLPPLQNTAKLLRKEKPKDLTLFTWKKTTCKEIVFLHGLYPLSDYHFRMIKCLLAEELKLKEREYKECDKIKFADLMAEKFIMDAGLGKLIALFEMLPPLQNTAELLRKEKPKDLTLFTWKENTCKEIVFLHGLYPLSDYHFRMIKCLLAEELKLKQREYKECDKIKFADLMADNFAIDAGLGKLIALFEMIPPLQNTAKLLRKEKPKDLTLFTWKENTCKEIVLLHSLYPLSDYHFRMIKCLLAEELKLKQREYKECDKIKFADLMSEKFIMDAGLGTLIELFEMLPPLQNTAELLRKENPKGLPAFPRRKNTCKETVFLHGLYPLSDYHFRMIKSLLAEELKLKQIEYEECDKIKLVDLMSEKFLVDAGLGKLIALFEMLPPLQNIAELLRKKHPLGLTAFPRRKNTCKEIVFLHGLYPLSDYHFRMIKCLLAEELKLKQIEYEECDKIKLADLMSEKFLVDAGLGKLIALFEMMPPLENTAELLRNESQKI